jgi:BirA family biotin operon repressor/biotin-[acetyl-CoA-carboxylase] ligase
LNGAWPAGTDLLTLDTVDSTSAEAARRAPEVERPTWVFARRQTAARGRRGRPWVAPAGNFGASLVWRPPGGPAGWALRSFAAALALADALAAARTDPARIALKWPNDVLLDGGKLAGILLETQGPSLILGVGVNLAAAPPAAEVEADAMRPVCLEGAVEPEPFLRLLAPAFDGWERTLVAHGFAPLRAAWTARAARMGERARVRVGPRHRDGVIEGLDAGGRLLLRTSRGVEALAAGDVFFPQATGA